MTYLKWLFILFSILDVGSTYLCLQLPGLEEGNPFMSAVWNEYGLFGLILSKFISSTLILFMVEWVEPWFPRVMFLMVLFMDLVLFWVIVSNLGLYYALS